ncbi:MAG: CHASE2 domain-containing protein [Proteobacteria bacterium]|nr:CHASE2 domain-containing protein [Pseudomonadota bacterium]
MIITLIRFLCREWLLGILLTLLVLFAVAFSWQPFINLELKTYDFRSKLRSKSSISPLVLINIDKESIGKIGEWPWPRDILAGAISQIASYGAKTTGIDLIFPEEAKNPAEAEIKALAKELKDGLAGKDRKKDKASIKLTKSIISRLEEMEKRLDTDEVLTSSIRSLPKAILPLHFSLKSRTASPGKGSERAFKHWRSGGLEAIKPYGTDVKGTNGRILKMAEGAGHNNLIGDPDGRIRREYLLIPYEARYYPSFALQLALAYLDGPLKPVSNIESIRTRFGLKIGELEIPAGDDFSMLISYPHEKSFPSYSFHEVIENKVPADAFKDKVVIIGLNIEDAGMALSPEVDRRPSPSFIMASVVDNILSSTYITRPKWAFPLEAGVIALFGLYLAFIAHRLGRRASLTTVLSMAVLWNLVAIYLFIEEGYWVSMFYPSFLLLFGYAFISVTRRLVFSQEMMESESLESNRLLAHSYQGQGRLDMAFEKLTKCPVKDPVTREQLYSLGLDFERKRMLNKAVAVYEHMLRGGKFKDVRKRIKQLKEADQQIVLGKNASTEKTVLISGAPTLPTLGRYEIARELGQGAMGTVYLGKDPKINREVAIKTLRYEELEEESAEEIKKRFFREAEAAGKLSHPNIVTIYDVGEDSGIAYLAMEFLEGCDLEQHLRKKRNMSIKEKISVVSAVANALDYAHRNGVVHRDIKPANIMILKDETVKVTDFGIARVMTSSKTQTGMILGTPSYMSPEQISGKKVDGRSDLFSLGIVFYELITGERPFKGDSFTNLMYNIANTTYTPAKELMPDTPEQLISIIEKMLAKGVTKRYQSGVKLAKDLEKAGKELGI